MRRTELALLVLVAVTLLVGGASLGAGLSAQQALRAGRPGGPIDLTPPDPRGLATYLGRAVRRPRRVRPGRAAHRPGAAAGHGAARRHRPAADAAAAAGARRPAVRRRRVRARPAPARLAPDRADGDRGPRARRPLGCLAADLQVHVGGRRDRPAAADVRVRQRRQRRPPHALDRPAVRAAVRAAEGDPRRLPRRLPVGEPLPARRREHANRADRACRRCRTSRRWS